jgi:hypothetical protein
MARPVGRAIVVPLNDRKGQVNLRAFLAFRALRALRAFLAFLALRALRAVFSTPAAALSLFSWVSGSFGVIRFSAILLSPFRFGGLLRVPRSDPGIVARHCRSAVPLVTGTRVSFVNRVL